MDCVSSIFRLKMSRNVVVLTGDQEVIKSETKERFIQPGPSNGLRRQEVPFGLTLRSVRHN